MKICYDMIENMRLSKRDGNFYNNGSTYYISPTVCEFCGEEFLVCGNRVSKYCSKSCTAKATLKGRKLPDSAKKKLSEIHIGEKNHMYGKIGPLSATYNSNKTDEEREIGRNYNSYYEWRKLVFKRDDWTCAKCGARGVPINAHHIASYSDNVDLRTTLSNGITLCRECHKDFHHQYGKGGNTIEQLNCFLNAKER